MSIPNPPNAPAGYVSEWTGTEWKVVPISGVVMPAQPTGIPAGYSVQWSGTEWVVSPPPPAPSPDQITGVTITTSVSNLQTIAYLTTNEMADHITQESRQEVTDYVHAMANILATAQTKYGTGEAYAPEFPPLPTAMPQLPNTARNGEPELVRPFIQFIVVE